jgi:hypothetical protein
MSILTWIFLAIVLSGFATMGVAAFFDRTEDAEWLCDDVAQCLAPVDDAPRRRLSDLPHHAAQIVVHHDPVADGWLEYLNGRAVAYA